MVRHKAKADAEKSIPEMVDELTRQEIATWHKDGKLTPHGREMAKFLDRAFPAEKVLSLLFFGDMSRKQMKDSITSCDRTRRLGVEFPLGQMYESLPRLRRLTMTTRGNPKP